MVRRFMMVVSVGMMALCLTTGITAQDGDAAPAGFRFDAPPYALRGPHPVGVRDFVLDEGSDRPLTGSIWYPALNPEGVPEAVTYDLGLGEIAPPLNVWNGRAIRDAEPDLTGGPYPLLVYSPGYGGTRFYGSFMHEHLASQGFVVVSVDHTGNTLADNFASPEQTEANRYASMVHRPLDVTRQIDYAESLNEGDWASLIDTENVGVYGVSFGGYTALMAGGAQLDMNAFREWCTGKEGGVPCASLLQNQSEMAALSALDCPPEGLWPPLGDPRVDAIAPIVPGMVPAIGADGLQGVTVPMLLIASGADQTVNPAEYPIVYENVSGPKGIVLFNEADHMLLGGLCPDAWKAFGPYCWDPVWDLDRAHDLYDHLLTAFFAAELKGDADAAAALAAEAVQFPGITYQTSGF